MWRKRSICFVSLSLFAKKLVAPPTRDLQLLIFGNCMSCGISGWLCSTSSPLGLALLPVKFLGLPEPGKVHSNTVFAWSMWQEFFGKSNVREFGCSPLYCFYWLAERPWSLHLMFFIRGVFNDVLLYLVKPETSFGCCIKQLPEVYDKGLSKKALHAVPWPFLKFQVLSRKYTFFIAPFMLSTGSLIAGYFYCQMMCLGRKHPTNQLKTQARKLCHLAS